MSINVLAAPRVAVWSRSRAWVLLLSAAVACVLFAGAASQSKEQIRRSEEIETSCVSLVRKTYLDLYGFWKTCQQVAL